MARAAGRFMSEVHGKIENACAHVAFMRNGKQFVNFLRQGWSPNKMTETQKIQCVKFTNQAHTANNIATCLKVLYAGITPTEQQTATSNAVKALIINKAGIVKGKPMAMLNFSNVYKEFTEQPRDENGTREYDTFNGFIIRKVMPLLTDECLQAVCAASGVECYEESLEGYEAMKKAGKASFIIAG
ncbi:MAG: hypothetical protein IKP73_00110 [Bacteroidales bacterium]|nr:hypothetical protein [Bacteroidales bacterium]